MQYNHPEFERCNPSRSPCWRFDRAFQLVQSGKRICRRKEDDLTLEAVKYLRHLGFRSCPEQLSQQAMRIASDLHRAHQIHDHGRERRWELEARFLARQTSHEIASKLSLAISVVDAYEAYFFQVRDALDASDWVVTRLIGPIDCHTVKPSRLWKAIAYTGGPLALDIVLACTASQSQPAHFPKTVMHSCQRLIDLLGTSCNLSVSQCLAVRKDLQTCAEGTSNHASQMECDDITRKKEVAPQMSECRTARSQVALTDG